MFRRTKRRIVIGLLAAALAGGGAAVNRDAIYKKTGIDVDFLNLRGVEKIKDAEKIMAKYSIKPEDMQKILSSKYNMQKIFRNDSRHQLRPIVQYALG